MSDWSEESGAFIGVHFECIADELIVGGSKRKLQKCGSSDALSIFEHEEDDGELWYDAKCYSCDQHFFQDEVHASSIAPELGILDSSGIVKERKKFELAAPAEPMNKAEVVDFMNKLHYDNTGYRGIREETNKFYKHLTQYSAEGKVIARYYPETVSDIPTGFKCRNHPKDFRYGKVGLTGLSCQLSGQHKFKSGGKYLLIVGGEEDKAAAFQMFKDNQIQKGNDEFTPMPVVSPTTGEGSAFKQIAAQYDWCDTFDNIILGFDNDEKGIEAMEKVAQVLPSNKVKIAHWSAKDPNKMLDLKMNKQFLRDFYGAKEYVASGILSSADLDSQIEKELLVEKLGLPPFMSRLQYMMAGGIPLGYIVNITAETGRGKTSIVNELIYFWIFNTPHLMGIVSLELTAAQYGQAMLSRHLGKKLSLFTDGQEAVDYINTPEAKEKRRELWTEEDGQPRFYLLDDREGTLGEVKRQCEILIKKYGCKFIVLDPLQDLLDGYSFEEQSVFMKWQKQMVKKGITFININHTRKVGGQSKDKDGNIVIRELGDDDIMGTSAIAKSGGANIYVTRDVTSEDVIIQNTSNVSATKIRWTGNSGPCGKWFYEKETHTLHDFDTFFTNNGGVVPERDITPKSDTPQIIKEAS